MKKKKEVPFVVEILLLPITWSMMIFKVLVTIPMIVIAFCNSLHDTIEYKK